MISDSQQTGGTHAGVRILLVIGGGGFMEESLALLEQIRHRCKTIVVSSEDCASVLQGRCAVPVTDTLPPLTLRSRGRLFSLRSLLAGLLAARRIMKRHQPDMVVCLGSSLALPVFLQAKIRRRTPTVFIESITRSERPSTTALLLQRLHLTDHMLMQWPELCDQLPGSRYEGTIL